MAGCSGCVRSFDAQVMGLVYPFATETVTSAGMIAASSERASNSISSTAPT